jgi:phage gpG-like protein
MTNSLKFSVDVELPINASALLKQAAAEAMKDVVGELTGRFDDAMSRDVWPWPRDSKRGVAGDTLKERSRAWKKASFNVGKTRNVVDSGDLKQSGELNYDAGSLSAEWVWTAEYAAAVHEGAWVHPWGDKTKQKVQLPARPWTKAVLQGGTAASVEVYDFAGEMQKRIPRYFNALVASRK